ncbi:MAG: hypothetical protein K6L81_07115 [Agarilytica sp.]
MTHVTQISRLLWGSSSQVGRTTKQCLFGLIFTAGAAAPLSYAEDYLYRYENDKGVKVLNHTIPPEYAQKGYDVLSTSGQLIRRVTAAPTDGAIAKENSERMLREKFAVLQRRFSSPRDIEDAKRRRLANINTNISIVRGNLGGINTRIENLMRQAADAERAGKAVPPSLLQQLGDARAELEVSEASLKARLEEYQVVSDRYDSDLATFAQGSALFETENFN